MGRSSTLWLAVSVALVACGRTAPLSTPGPLAADASRSPAADGPPAIDQVARDAALPSIDAASTSVEVASFPQTHDDAAPAAGLDLTRDGFARADGGRVGYHAIAVATGEVHTCVLLDDHRVKCWGDNSFGQLGYGDTRRRGSSPSEMGDALPIVDLGTGRSATAIAASRYASCAILDDGSVRCWGWAALSGQGPVPDNLEDIGDDVEEMGDHLQAADFGGRRAVHLAMGEFGACASMADDTIWCWGEGTKPSLQFSLPVKGVAALASSGSEIVALYDDGTIGPQLPNGTVPLLKPDRKATAVAGSAGSGTCALLEDGTTICAVGTGGAANAIAIGVERFGGLCSAYSDGSVRCHEQNCLQPTYYQCSSDGSFPLGAPAVSLTSNGSDFACALLEGGDIKCWGANLTMPPAAWLGAAIDFTETSDGISYGAWHSVDLGTHP